MALELEYEGREYTLDLDDMDMLQVRAMERAGVPTLKALEEGLMEGEMNALTVGYWLMMVQNGQPGQRLERVVFKPMKFAKAIAVAYYVALKQLEAEAAQDAKDAEEGKGDGEDSAEQAPRIPGSMMPA